MHEAAIIEEIAFEKYNEALEALTQLILQGGPKVSPTNTKS
jgi:hypothetical protein